MYLIENNWHEAQLRKKLLLKVAKSTRVQFHVSLPTWFSIPKMIGLITISVNSVFIWLVQSSLYVFLYSINGIKSVADSGYSQYRVYSEVGEGRKWNFPQEVDDSEEIWSQLREGCMGLPVMPRLDPPLTIIAIRDEERLSQPLWIENESVELTRIISIGYADH